MAFYITFSRLIAAPFIFLLIAHHFYAAALLLIFWGFVSDDLDGWVARKEKKIDPLGFFLDPVADKVLVLFLVLYLFLQDAISPSYTFLIFMRQGILSSTFFVLKRARVSFDVRPQEIARWAVFFSASYVTLSYLVLLYTKSSQILVVYHLHHLALATSALFECYLCFSYPLQLWNILQKKQREFF